MSAPVAAGRTPGTAQRPPGAPEVPEREPAPRSGLPSAPALAAEGLAAAAASALLAGRLAGDPLVGSVAVAPLAAWAFALLARAGRERGARPLPATAAALAGGAWTLLVLGALGYRAAGLAATAPVLAAGFGAVALAVAGLLAWSFRPLLERGGRPTLLFFWLPLVLYLALLPWSAGARAPDGDEPYYLLIAHSLATDGDADLADEYAGGAGRRFLPRPLAPQPGDPVGPHGELYSRHNLLLPALLVPGYLVAGRWGALVLMAAAAAALAWWLLGLALRRWPGAPETDGRAAAGAALGVYSLLAFTWPLVGYSHQVWVEVPAALLVAWALSGILDLAEEPGKTSWRHWAKVAVPLLLLPLLKLRFFLLVVPLVGLAAWAERHSAARTLVGERRPGGGVLRLGGAVALLAAVVLAFNRARYGNPLKNHRPAELDPTSFAPTAWIEGLLGFFWDAAFGLFGAAPLWLLLVPAVPWAALRDRRRLAAVALVAGPYLLVAAPRLEWYGGWAPPFRYGMAVLPLLALLLVPLFAAWSAAGPRRRHAFLVGLLGAATALLALLWLAVPGWTYDLAHGRTHLTDGLSAMVGGDVARLVPSYVRPRLASWLWPPLSLLALAALAWPRPGSAAGELDRAGDDRRARVTAPTGAIAGAAAALALLALVPAAATLLPTRVAEIEDPWIAKRGGGPHPDTWAVARAAYRGGWRLAPGDAVEVPVVSGGERLAVRLALRLERPGAAIELRRGEALLDRFAGRRFGHWQEIEMGPWVWPEAVDDRGEPLVLVVPAVPGVLPGRSAVVLDRVELDWSPAPEAGE